MIDLVRSHRLVAIIRKPGEDEARAAATEVLAAGVRLIEVTMTTPGALRLIRELTGAWPDAVVGAGTVLTARAAEAAIEAGARFVVAPNVDRAVIEAAHDGGAAAVPGAFTPTEALTAMSFGADVVKLYPASGIGLAAFGDLCRALGQVPFMPTGGVTVRDAPEWIRAGAVAVGMGDALTRASPGELAGLLTGLGGTG
ncbi:bifunctional 4-hydroxy-2-oxoglutarate aldolase/2-dehydro-3-deoxy-phosphogluconate aldolase [Streptosporangium sp. V21-05]|uniref:bifunctional 4-hydroxy-2-oxoglutarate aldolase/2-dehydro-3-deoxy-phosphogluconate aldolase n=1 Tax=Streptosporangium sp. V21-05 TaxID=3446115 RepID=UPI003F52A244